MEDRAIPKDVVAAAKYIPRNDKLTFKQKVGRCRQCVIYNEHQKHKYKLWLYITIFSFVGLTAGCWGALLSFTGTLIHGMDTVYGQMTFRKSDLSSFLEGSNIPFEALLLGVILLMAFTSALRLLEYLIFKAKI